MEDRVLDIMEEVFGVKGLDRTCSQGNCEKWDSLAHLNLIVELESEFGVTFEPEEIGEMTSYEKILEIMNDLLSAR